ncbi:Crp/Fnr family transcriptional regulator [Roseivirga pacifica]|uniref:Crp/Fnr family transcriptional regulator n=1 Tax=Roseivirga pacifica TaxID=1267423 RepID=UPI003BAA7026
MINHFSKINEVVATFDREVKNHLNSIEHVKRFSKGELLLAEGKVCRKSFHISKGIARKFFRNDAKEVTTDFFFQDDIAIAFNSYTFQTPSRETIQCLTDVEARVTHREDWDAAKAKFPQLLELDILLTEIHAGLLDEELYDLRVLSATERYQKLLTESPEVLQSVKLTHIASYLNISLETLSRIRARL